jgi:hypothetical protein
MSEFNYCALNKVYPGWVKLETHIQAYSKLESSFPFWQDIHDYYHRIRQGSWRDRVDKQLLLVYIVAFKLTLVYYSIQLSLEDATLCENYILE